MKLVLFFTIFIFAIASVTSNRDNHKRPAKHQRRFSKYAIIHQLLEMMRDVIKSGDKEKGVPILDPYESHNIQVDYSGNIFNITANITNGTLSGLGDFYVTKSDFDKDDVCLNLKMIFPQLRFVAEFYKMEGNLWGFIPLSGQGIIDVEVHYVTTLGKFYLKPSLDGESILIDKIEEPKFFIEKIISRTEFDNNIDNILNRMIGDLLADYLIRFNGFITTHFTEMLVDLMNPILDNFNTWQMLNTIL